MEISALTDDELTHCQHIFSEKGRLSTAIPGFIARQSQVTLALAVTEAIRQKSILVAEAGTGTGKTFAYLVPCLLSGKKALISTATKTLQDQLFQKDLPLLARALGRAINVQNLKGRANYLCRYRIEQHAEEGLFSNPQLIHDILKVKEKLPQLAYGERSELPEIKEDSPLWSYITSTTDNCLGSECAYYQECFLVKARKRALDADLIIINHHLFFADSRLKEEGFGELLPGAEVVVFDEAHQLAEIAAHFNEERLGTRQLRDLIDDILHEWPVLDLANQPLKKLSLETDQVIDQLIASLPLKEEKLSWDVIERNQPFQKAWQQLLQLIDTFLDCLKDVEEEESAGLKRCAKRLEAFKTTALTFQKSNKTLIKWIERYKHALVLHATPYDVAQFFQLLLKQQLSCAYVFTSATLTMGASFDCFTKPLGLEQATTLLLPSPFNYMQQALLYLPRFLPDPNDPSYYQVLVEKALPIIDACQGRCFFLFTSHRALKLVAELLMDNLDYPLLIQGEEAKPILLARFRQLGNAVLLGTATFWEGVDVKGEALSCVIIDKLPFASPVDPVMRGKITYLKAQGLSSFDELSLPNAVLALKQGVGRLIRDTTDKGVLMIADPRLTGRTYGRQIFASLPLLQKTRDEQCVLNFINQLAFNNEVISV
ncbi:ATP dependent DNA helicase (DEAD box family) Rad3 [Legionella beliardensis]|uniref:ATP dependent DNA helicase (DEAD box family) Rad3 n=1 Tax=Legionella beliardensis TaxID=91822 RepID=A0A378I343_9GAMM|nr:ATP-dependent DNA helicase [Legionella beliardensis]STX29413.1 ATP dependent DNA helicase (DEAD box family) Rad3 [Legionella beliardensis]